MIWLLITIIMLPFTIYFIKRKPDWLVPDPEFEQIEREVKEWLRRQCEEVVA